MLSILNGPLNRPAHAVRVGSGVFQGILAERNRAVNSGAVGSTPTPGAMNKMKRNPSPATGC